MSPEGYQNLVNGFQNREADATSTLIDILTPKLLAYFNHSLSDEAEDLTQNTLFQIFQAINRFDPELGHGNFDQNFFAWVYSIARAVKNQEITRRMHIDICSLDDNLPSVLPSESPIEEDVFTLLASYLEDYLSASQLSILQLSLTGHSNSAIADILSLTPKAVSSSLYRIRILLEKEFLYPAGYIRVSDSHLNSLNQAVFSGRLPGLKVCGVYYTTKENIELYERTKRKQTDASLLSDGYQLVCDCVSPAEYSALHSQTYRHLLLRHQGRLYIKSDDLESFRCSYQRQSHRPNPNQVKSSVNSAQYPTMKEYLSAYNQLERKPATPSAIKR